MMTDVGQQRKPEVETPVDTNLPGGNKPAGNERTELPL